MSRIIPIAVLLCGLLDVQASAGTSWRQIDVGLEVGHFKLPVHTVAGDSTVTILRIEPVL